MTGETVTRDAALAMVADAMEEAAKVADARATLSAGVAQTFRDHGYEHAAVAYDLAAEDSRMIASTIRARAAAKREDRG